MTAAPRPCGSAFGRQISRLARERRSVMAVEFALLASAFFFFVLGMFMVGVVQYWQMTLDDAVRVATRSVAIGQVTTNTGFATAVCNEFGLTTPNCNSTLQFDVQSASYFSPSAGSNYVTPATLSSNGLSTNQNGTSASLNLTLSTPAMAGANGAAATPGNTEVLLVQVAYPLPFSIPWLGGAFTENGTSSLYSAVATVME